MRLSLTLALLALGCGGGTKKPKPTEIVFVGSCPEGPPLGLYLTVAPSHSPDSQEFTTAEGAAHGDEIKARSEYEAGHYAQAAELYLSCGTRYSAVPDDDRMREHAVKNARNCLSSSVTMYSNAGTFARDGRSKLAAAATSDPRLASTIDELLAHGWDCQANR